MAREEVKLQAEITKAEAETAKRKPRCAESGPGGKLAEGAKEPETAEENAGCERVS